MEADVCMQLLVVLVTSVLIDMHKYVFEVSAKSNIYLKYLACNHT